MWKSLLIAHITIIFNAAAPFAQLSDVSSKSCEELGWDGLKFGNPNICSQSNMTAAGCSGKLLWYPDILLRLKNIFCHIFDIEIYYACRSESVSFCSAAGARLCTYDEIRNDEAKSSGCFLDSQLVWTNSPCLGGFILTFGSFQGRQFFKCNERTERSPKHSII